MNEMNGTNETNTQKVAYWTSGAWTDPDTAALAAELGAFPDDYRIAEFPADADPAFIDSEVLALLGE